MKKVIAIALALMMTVVLMTGCSLMEQAKLVGTWEAEVDLSEAISQEILGEVGDLGEYFTVADFKVTYIMELKSDSTYTTTLDEASVATAFDALMEDLMDGMVEFLEAEIENSGLDMTVEEMLTASGSSLDTLKEELKASLEEEDVVEELIEETSEEGRFKVADGKLYMSAGLEYNVDENVYDTYTLDGDKLTLVEHVGEDAEEDEISDLIYPMEFQKVG